MVFSGGFENLFDCKEFMQLQFFLVQGFTHIVNSLSIGTLYKSRYAISVNTGLSGASCSVIKAMEGGAMRRAKVQKL